MRKFLNWFNRDSSADLVAKAALAHLWFVTVHPFDDGNGRIARAVADMALAQSESTPQRFYSMSAQIREERGAYYRTRTDTKRVAGREPMDGLVLRMFGSRDWECAENFGGGVGAV